MELEIKTWLTDIDKSIDEIYSFLPSETDFFEFRNDLKTKKAIERNLEINGEALNRTLKLSPTISITDSRKIVDTRNRIIHNYDNVTDDIIWSIVIRSLPKLKTEVRDLLNNYN